MTTELEGVLRRIKKCLALSGSPNPHEAATALAMAQKLMAAHNISEAALVDAEVTEARAPATVISSVPRWEALLSQEICRVFGVERLIRMGYVNPELRSDFQRASWCYLGTNGAAETASYAHTVVVRAALKAKDAFMTERARPFWSRKDKITASNSFLEGYVAKAFDALPDIVPDAARAEAIERRKKSELSDEKPRQPRATQRWGEALAAGVQAGSELKIHAGVGAAAGQARLANGGQA